MPNGYGHYSFPSILFLSRRPPRLVNSLIDLPGVVVRCSELRPASNKMVWLSVGVKS